MQHNLLATTVAGLLAATAAGLVIHGCSDSSKSKGFVASTAAPSTTRSTTSPTASSSFTVLATAPADRAADVAVDAAIYLTFNADVAPASLAAGAIQLSNDRGPVAADAQALTARVVSVTPRANMRSATPHLLRVTSAVSDVAGNPLAADHLIRFGTSPVVPIVGIGGASIPPAIPGPYRAGAAAIDITPPVGVPLAGFGGGDRRHKPLPDLNPFNYHTFLNPSTGVRDPIKSKVVVIDNGHERVAIVALDAIATESKVVREAVRKAAARGFSVPLEKVLVGSSHTHSGPGTMTHSLMWQIIAADLYQGRVFDAMTTKIADSLVAAEGALTPAKLGVASEQVTTATRNRRHSDSPQLNVDSIDPEMLVIRVDKTDGTPIATVWNFAMHGTHFGARNLEYSADMAGSASDKAEVAGAGVAIFLNGCEGDIKPQGDYDATGQILADAIMSARRQALTASAGILQNVAEMIDLGQPVLSLALHRNAPPRIANSGFVQALSRLGLSLGFDFVLPRGWLEREYRFQAIRIGQDVIASLPGEPIHEIGLILKRDGKAMGFRNVFTAALANGHASYFTTDQEFQYGGYEGMATMFGPNSGTKLMDAVRKQMDKLKP